MMMMNEKANELEIEPQTANCKLQTAYRKKQNAYRIPQKSKPHAAKKAKSEKQTRDPNAKKQMHDPNANANANVNMWFRERSC